MMDSDNYQVQFKFEHDSSSIDKICGAVLGAAIGDALGWPQERPSMRSRIYSKGNLDNVTTSFKTWYRRSGGRFFAYEEKINAGEYSDDTQLILATIRSMQKGINWNKAFCMEELPIWLLYERGGGQATKSAAESWLRGIPPWRENSNNTETVKRYFKAGGNGVAMRILPHALLPSNTEQAMYQQIMLNGILTHGHPVALVGALLYGKCVQLAFRNKGALRLGALIDELIATRSNWSVMPRLKGSFEEWSSAADRYVNGYANEWEIAVNNVLDGLSICKQALQKGALAVDSKTLQQIGCFDRRLSGAGTIAALAAIYLASRYAADPKTGLLEAAFATGADTDTIASMLGGIFGALFGTEWILPEWQQVQDSKYLKNIANIIVNLSLDTTTTQSANIKHWKRSQTNSILNVLDKGTAADVDLESLGRAKIIDTIHHKPLTKSTQAQSWNMSLESGQTIYIGKLARIRESSQVERTFQKHNLYTTYETTSKEQEIVSLLRELANRFSFELSSSNAFNITAQVLEVIDKEMIRLGREKMEAKLYDPRYLSDLMNDNKSLQLDKMKPNDVVWLAETIVRYLARTRSR